MQSGHSSQQLSSRALADTTNITTALKPAAASAAAVAAASKESSGFSLGLNSCSAAAPSAQWPHATSASVGSVAATDGTVVAATPEQLSMLVTAATAAATRAVAETLLHSRQSRRASKDSAADRDTSTQQLPQPPPQVPQQPSKGQQLEQVLTSRSADLQQPEQQLLRFAQPSAAPSASTSGMLSRQQSGSTTAAAASRAASSQLQGPIIRVPAAAPAPAPVAGDGADEIAAPTSGVPAFAEDAVCFPRLWPEPAAPGDQHQQQQLLPERSRVSIVAELSDAALAAAPSASSSRQQLVPAAADTPADGAQAADSSSASPSTAEQAVFSQGPPAAAATAQAGTSTPNPDSRASEQAVPATQPQADNLAASAACMQQQQQQHRLRPSDSSPAGSSSTQQLAAQPLEPPAAPAATSAHGNCAGAPGAGAGAGTAAAPEPVALPVELGSAVQRALKTLTDPTPPRPLLPPEQAPAAVMLQQRHQDEADRYADDSINTLKGLPCPRFACLTAKHSNTLLACSASVQFVFVDVLLSCVVHAGRQCSCWAAGLTTHQPCSACRTPRRLCRTSPQQRQHARASLWALPVCLLLAAAHPSARGRRQPRPAVLQLVSGQLLLVRREVPGWL